MIPHLPGSVTAAGNLGPVVLMMPIEMYVPGYELNFGGKDRTMTFRLKRCASLILLSFSILATAAACEHESDGHFPFAYVQDDCGPTDGLALHFYLTQKQSESGKYKEPFLDFTINENLPMSAPQDYSINPGSAAVFASRCPAPAQCVGATSGTLHLTKFDARSGVSGEYKLRFQDGGVEEGSFDATRRFVRFLCG
jgi:hypothetical protein